MDDDAYGLVAGDIVELLLEDAGVVERELRVAARAQRLDAVFTPSQHGLARLGRRGLLGRLAQRVCRFEFFHHAPSLATLLTGVRVVAVGELHGGTDTLTLRRMGRGAVLRGAMAEFDALPAGAPERVLADAVIQFMARRRRENAMSPRTDFLRQQAREYYELRSKDRMELFTMQFQLQLRRELTEPEQTALRTRLDQMGPARRSEVVLDFDGDALAAWLGAPDAR